VKPTTIAILAYAITAAYTVSIGAEPQAPWDEAPDEKKDSVLKDVEFLIANPEAGFDALHNQWLAQKQSDGWVYGEEVNEEAKTHPNILPFNELSQELQTRDQVFYGTVKAALSLPEEKPAEVEPEPAKKGRNIEPAKQSGTPIGYTPVKYVGKRETYIENLYGTRIQFTQGGTELVPEDKAVLLLRHPDQYVLGDIGEAAQAPQATAPNPNKDKDTEEDLQQARDAVNNMTIAACREYAKTHFAGRKLPVGINTETARKEVIQLIDQYGLK